MTVLAAIQPQDLQTSEVHAQTKMMVENAQNTK